MSTTRVTDAELVARARAGDQAAFGGLVDRHRLAVYRAALAALGSSAEAEDAAQDAFVLAWRRLGAFRGDASFKTWLLAIAWRQAINRRRWLVRWWRRLGDAPDLLGSPTTRLVEGGSQTQESASRTRGGWTPEQLVAAGELGRDIRQAIGALSPTLRDALLLAQSGEYRYEEIGAMLAAPVGTIKWRVSEARRMVKKHLQHRGHVRDT